MSTIGCAINQYHCKIQGILPNWIFDYDTEQVIKILPESFFAVCAVFIISMVVILSTIVIVYGFMHKEKKHELRNSSSDEQQA